MIAEILKEGRQNAITGEVLGLILGISRHEVYSRVEKERREGRPICATSGRNPGYYLAAHAGEMRDYIEALHSRIMNILVTYKACKETLNALPPDPEAPGEQMNLFSLFDDLDRIDALGADQETG